MKRNSRRTKTRFKLFFFVFIACLFSIPSEPKEYSVNSLDNVVTVHFQIESLDQDKIIKALEKGQTASISYNLRIFQKAEGLASYFGDTLIDEKFLNYLIKYDIFQNEYLVKKYNGKLESYPDIKILLKELFELEDYKIYLPVSFVPKNCYMLIQLKVNTLKLFPPLNVISFLIPGLRFESEIFKEQIIAKESINEASKRF